jgi:hypothetical protein
MVRNQDKNGGDDKEEADCKSEIRCAIGRRREEQRDILALAPAHTACNIDVLAILM